MERNPYTFKGIQAGDRVYYRTPQGQILHGKAQRLLLFPEHVVCVVRNGQAQVVNASNYVRHVPGPDRRIADD